MVRPEPGPTDRAIYEIAFLHAPVADKLLPGLQHRSAGWNRRLVFSFGGGCTSGWYRQGTSTGGGLHGVQPPPGDAVASSSLNLFGNNPPHPLPPPSMIILKHPLFY